MKSEDFTLQLRAETGAKWRLPTEQRLRAALKRLLRDYGLKAVVCHPTVREDSVAARAIPSRRDLDLSPVRKAPVQAKRWLCAPPPPIRA